MNRRKIRRERLAAEAAADPNDSINWPTDPSKWPDAKPSPKKKAAPKPKK